MSFSKYYNLTLATSGFSLLLFTYSNAFPLDSNSRFVMIYRGGKSFNYRAIRRSYEALEPMVF